MINSKFSVLAVLSTLVFSVACGVQTEEDGDIVDNTPVVPAAGGSSSTGGSSATGGSSEVGGSSATGGSTSTTTSTGGNFTGNPNEGPVKPGANGSYTLLFNPAYIGGLNASSCVSLMGDMPLPTVNYAVGKNKMTFDGSNYAITLTGLPNGTYEVSYALTDCSNGSVMAWAQYGKQTQAKLMQSGRDYIMYWNDVNGSQTMATSWANVSFANIHLTNNGGTFTASGNGLTSGFVN